MEEEEELYGTTDFYTTAMLISKKFEIKKVTSEGREGRTKKFYFEDSDELRETLMRYMNAALEGNIREFRNAIDVVKDLVYSS